MMWRLGLISLGSALGMGLPTHSYFSSSSSSTPPPPPATPPLPPLLLSLHSSSPSTPPLSILLLSIYYCSPSTSILPFTAQLHLCHKPSFTRPQQSSELLLRLFGGNSWFAKENKLSDLQLSPPPNEKKHSKWQYQLLRRVLLPVYLTPVRPLLCNYPMNSCTFDTQISCHSSSPILRNRERFRYYYQVNIGLTSRPLPSVLSLAVQRSSFCTTSNNKSWVGVWERG